MFIVSNVRVEEILNNLEVIRKVGVSVIRPKKAEVKPVSISKIIVPLYEEEECNYLSLLSFADQFEILEEICGSPKCFLIYDINESKISSSGFAFSINPITCIDDEVVIEGREKLKGLKLVREFDRFIFNKKNGELIELFYYGSRPHIDTKCVEKIFRDVIKIEKVLGCEFVMIWICSEEKVQVLSVLCIDVILQKSVLCRAK